MIRPRSCTLTLTALCAAAVGALAAEKPMVIPTPANFSPAAGKLVFKGGDTVVFLGDSITAQCLYTQYLEDFYYTRFPRTRIHFHNAGTAGDRVADALERFETDVAAFKPQYVSVLFGMNDGNFTEWQQPAFEIFQKNMAALLERIGQAGATPIPMTPTTYDSLPNRLNNRVIEARDNGNGYNKVMETYGAWMKEQAKARKGPMVDLFKPLTDATNDRRRTEQDWTMMPDTVHPTATGHVLIAAAFLNDVAFRPSVSEVLISKKDNQWTSKVGNGEVSELRGGDDKVTFTFAAESLPWVLPPEADEGRKLIAVAYKNPPNLSGEKLAVRGLAPGTYELKIDGDPVGRWTDAELATGIDLGENPKTPQYQQSLEVALLNKKRNAMSQHPMRIDWAQLKGQQKLVNEAEADTDRPNRLEQAKKSFARFYEGNQQSITDYIAAARKLEDQIYRVNAPLARKYEVVLVTGAQ